MSNQEMLDQELGLLQVEIEHLGGFTITRDDEAITVAHDEGAETVWILGVGFAVAGGAICVVLGYVMGLYVLAAGLAAIGFACIGHRKRTVLKIADADVAAGLTYVLRRNSGLSHDDRKRELVATLRLCRGSAVTPLPSVWDRVVHRGA